MRKQKKIKYKPKPTTMFFTYSSEKQGNIHIFILKGDLIDKNQADKLIEEVNEIILNNHIRFVVDLGNLKYLNSSGLTILIQILTKARKAGGEAVIANVGKRIKELLVITKLNTVFTVADTVEQGIAKLNKLVSN
ncbi:MAG: STAS domain-containing protein [Bacteroidetes bacterium]|nr:STAS domain-containing protein [Bacteroidota bacterium]